LENLDYWRFCDELTVVQAALLIVDQDPTGIAEYVDGWNPEDRPKGYVAVLNALKLSIVGDRLRAKKAFRNLDYQYADVEHPIRSLDWPDTRVSIDDLREWLGVRGVQSSFFFPDGPVTAEYLDKKNENFAPKLAAVVEAWKAVRVDRLSKPSARTVKQDLVRWLNLHAAEYGLTNEDGGPNKQAIEEISKVANWDTKGGAPKTPSKPTHPLKLSKTSEKPVSKAT
jgi:hypothetical protein